MSRVEYLSGEKNRLEALISHLEGSGAANYDFAPGHIFSDKIIPSALSKKTAADFLQQYKDLLNKIEEELKELQKYES